MKKFLFLLIFFPFSVFSQTQTPLSKFISSENLSSATVSILIKDIQSGENVVEYRSQTDAIPASLVKLITTSTALEILCDTFRFKTQIEYDGNIDADSILKGNLYIRGGGDPTLESAYRKEPNNFYTSAVRAVKELGIKKIEGGVVGDASLYEETGSPFQWLVEDIGSSYSPAPSALSVHDNLLNVTLVSDSFCVSLSKVSPFTGLFSPVLNLKTGGKEAFCRIYKTDFSWQPLFIGQIPSGKLLEIKTEIPEPALFIADSLTKLLRMYGIEVIMPSRTIRTSGKNDAKRTLIYTYYSEPLKNIVRETNYRSLNLYAENIFRYLALQKDSVAASARTASSVVSEFWKSKGLPVQKIFQVDGSGLSMKNAVNADFFIKLLTYMHTKGTYKDAFFSSLPVAGVSGTVASFLKDTGLSGKVYAKSGSMERVQNYSGYILYQDKWYAFCIMVNNFSGDRQRVKNQISAFLNSVFLNR